MKHLLKLCVPILAIFVLTVIVDSTVVKATPGPTLNVSMSGVTGVDKTGAMLNGSVSYGTGSPVIIERGFQYGTDTSYGSSAVASSDPGVGDFNAAATSLSCGTTYHVRAYAKYSVVTYTKSTSRLAFLVNVAHAAPPDPYVYSSDSTFTTDRCTTNFRSTKSSHRSASAGSHTTANTTPLVTGGVTQTSVITTASTTLSNQVFERDLKIGSQGDDVQRLQQYLNKEGFLVAEAGPGSLGNETTYFGSATKAALIQFQTAKGIVPASGYFGLITRAYIQSH